MSTTTVCIGNDPGCPCQDGDACHYRDIPGSPGWPAPLAATLNSGVRRIGDGLKGTSMSNDTTDSKEAREELQKARDDAFMFGTGWIMVTPEGIARVPPGDIIVRRPTKKENDDG